LRLAGLAIGFLEHLVACIMPFCPCCKSHGDQEVSPVSISLSYPTT